MTERREGGIAEAPKEKELTGEREVSLNTARKKAERTKNYTTQRRTNRREERQGRGGKGGGQGGDAGQDGENK